jgi:hypothetical protein
MGKAALVSSHDHVIRAKLLNRLGIHKNVAVRNSNVDCPRQKHKHTEIRSIGTSISTTTSGSRSIVDNVVPFFEPLKDHQTRNETTIRLARRQGRIHFNTDVTVLPIPSHHEYSSRIKKFLWSNGEEIQENAARNRIEFASEGWDWHTVLEDDDMYVDANTGELVHPCWFDEGHSEAEEDYMDIERPSLSRSESFSMGLHKLRE